MGTLAGHLLPGIMFIGIGLWWSTVTAVRFILSKKKSPFKANSSVGYKSTVAMPCLCMPTSRLRRAPIESWIKLVLGTIGALGEAYTGYKVHWHPQSFYDQQLLEHQQSMLGLLVTSAVSRANTTQHIHHHNVRGADDHVYDFQSSATPEPLIRSWSFEKVNAQHITMYSMFILGSIVEILMYHGANLPAKLDQVCGVIAFGVEAFIFANHLHGRSMLDTTIHVYLVYSIYGCVLFSLAEVFNSKQVLFTYGRILFTILQGTWFWQAGFILFPPNDKPIYEWEPNNHGHVMLITISFCWHLMTIMVFLLIELALVSRLYSCSRSISNLCDQLMSIDDQLGTFNARNKSEDQKYFTMLGQEDEDDEIFDRSKLLPDL